MAAGRRAYWKGGEMGRQTEENDENDETYTQVLPSLCSHTTAGYTVI